MNSLKILTLNTGLLEIDVPILRSITLVKKKNLRAQAMIDILKQGTHDVVMLQEIGGRYLKRILREVSHIFPYHATHHAWKLFSYNLLILSKLPLANISFTAFNKQTNFESWGIKKGFLCAEISWNDTPYHLINTHLVASGTETGDASPKTLRVRNEQIGQIKDYVRTHYSKDDIVIIGGDFNSGPLTCKENYDVMVDELYDVMQHVPEEERITWTAQNPLVRKSTKQDPDKQIDGFYMHQHHYEQMKSSIAINRAFMDEVEVSHKKGTVSLPVSDHYGVEMVLVNKHKNTE